MAFARWLMPRFDCNTIARAGAAVRQMRSKRKIPSKAAPAARPVRVVAAILEREGRILVGRRRPDQPLAGQWEFPGGKVKPSETPRAALARELREELGVQASVGRELY